MSERPLMERLVRALNKRRRLWPPDGASSMACLGLLGWMHLLYLPPDRMEQQTKDWMWLGGLAGLGRAGSRPNAVRPDFDAGDQRAIDAYAAAVAGRILEATHERQAQDLDVSRDGRWPPEDIEALMALGAVHGSVMREIALGLFTSFELGNDYALPMFGATETSYPAGG